MKQALEIALKCIADDQPIPVDLAADLLSVGIDVENLEPSTPADTQLTTYTQLELDI